jgi:hypothetical protein
MKIRRKFSACPNCGNLLERKDNFCPECGQENDDKNVSFSIIFREFLDTFFALDSSFIRTFKPFIFRPGYLTKQFVSGKRKSYANPIRLYLIISIFYFFTIGTAVRHMVNSDSAIGKSMVATDSVANAFSTVINLDEDSLSNWKKRGLLKDSFEDMNIEQQSILFDKLEEEEINELFELGVVNYQTMSRQFQHTYTYAPDSAHYPALAADSSEFILSRVNEPLIRELDYRGDYSDQQILDSMHLGELKWWEQYLALQHIRIERSGGEAVMDFVLRNLPIMMMLVIPLFAVVLKLLYIRKNVLYVQHLVHALHLHSFAYLFFGIANIMLVYVLHGEEITFFLWLVSIITVNTYAYISFLKVYGQGWFKTLVKYNLAGGIYFMTIFAFAILETLISILLF